jgi:hypothetical protein
MFTTIAYKETVENNIPVRIYFDETEKSFASYQDAVAYSAYLFSKGYSYVDIYEKVIIPEGGFDLDDLIRQDALAKLTEQEKEILGL